MKLTPEEITAIKSLIKRLDELKDSIPLQAG